ncbi:MAG: sigma 54-interacting transcriptional regulator [Desulfuromonadales bacterium]|nr:sigma 54-interacting transcriptional regulator [Desulfuromonadales bacterium]
MPILIHNKKISLAEVNGKSGTSLPRGDSAELDSQAAPTLRDLTECIFFSPGDGRIWLNNTRMVLLHNLTLGLLRQELVDTIGTERTRGMLTRIGYVSGVEGARLVRNQWPNAEPITLFAAGTRLHALEGAVQVETLHINFDAQKGIYNGEFIWHNSSEAEAHITTFGIGTQPACWMQLGYAMGYVSTLFGKPVIFREIECRCMGHPACRVVGKTAEQWDDVSEDLRYLKAENFVADGFAPILEAEDLPHMGPAFIDSEKEKIVGISVAFAGACHRLKRVAPTCATVLFLGESGVGKELFAQMLHEIGPRQSKPFVSVNCAAIPDTLVESELFGVERGAYTGAVASRAGRFERADGGTLFLDEVTPLSLVAQGKLLRALQEGEVERVGGSRTIRVNVRVVAACNVDLRKEVEAGRFREDLYFRLNVFPVYLPPLRERREDIPLLINYFLHRYNKRHGRNVVNFTSRALTALMNYDFPGNIRELQNLVERGVISAEEDCPIDLHHLFVSGESSNSALFAVAEGGRLAEHYGATHKEKQEPTDILRVLAKLTGNSDAEGISIEAVDHALMDLALERSGGKLSPAARLLGLTRPQLAYRLQKRKEPGK